jgi:3-mercaptopyruvate sulfurtransferase SseA
MSDWLGTDIHRRGNWRSFEEARTFVQTLGLKSAEEWRTYCRSGEKPIDIPRAPWQVYADAGWVSFTNWLGHKDWRPFKEGRAFARTLLFKSTTRWRAYCSSGKKPNDVPKSPDTVYANAGWIDWGDWLGYEARHRDEYRSFEEARAFVQKLKLKSGLQWRVYCRSGKKPKDIPSTPEGVYADTGWTGMSDWLGSGRYFRGGWRPFNEARAFVRSLKLKSQAEWFTYCRLGRKPLDIPTLPSDVYADQGWISMVDWLGAGRRVGNWRPFNDARAFVRRLGLKNGHEWNAYCRSGKKPNDIPTTPMARYADAGWIGMSDWLGTDIHRRGNSWRPFEEARAFARTLGIRSSSVWLRQYARSEQKPNDIPAVPNKAYADHWIDWDDWLGPGRRRPVRNWRGFEEARAFARKLKLSSYKEWTAYCRTGKRPNDIPFGPDRIYADTGWAGWGDWLANGRRQGNWRPFEKARAHVRGLKLKSGRDWHEYCRSGKKPDDIPSNAASVYADTGWIGTCDWLGGGRRRVIGCRSFTRARAFVRGLKLKGWDDWREYCRSGKKPNDIPSTPQAVYADAGWAGLGDWLGNGRACEWRNFSKARAFVRKLGLKSTGEWQAYCRSGKKPNDIPYAPHHSYADTGWVGYSDWLGNGRRRGPWRSFIEARAFVKKLKLSSYKDWTAYCSSGKRPNDIPSAPNIVYANKGWAGWGDWLGADVRRVGNWREFEEARAFVQKLQLNAQKEWVAYCRSGKKPNDIPSTPERVYATVGWAGLDDWVGKVREQASSREAGDATTQTPP